MGYLIIIIFSLLMSFFFSGTETAFVSLNKVRVELWRRQNERIAAIILPFLEKPEKFLYSTLIGNNIFNVAFATLATIYFNKFIDPEWTWLSIVFLTLIIGEILPKTIFRSLADWVIKYVSYPLHFFYYLFLPMIAIISKISESLMFFAGFRNHEVQRFFSDQDIEILLHESESIAEYVTPRGAEYLRRALGFRNLRVREAIIPRAEMIAVEDTISLDELYRHFTKSGHTKLPVYHDNLDQIVGVVFLKDLFQNPPDLQSIIREVMFVPDTKRCSQLLTIFKQNNISIAIVFDEYGGTAGMVTTTNLVSELFGDIDVEFSPKELMIRKLSHNAWMINARIEIDDLNESLNTKIPDGDYETLAGYLLVKIGHIPKINEQIEIDDYRFIVISASRRRIQHVKMIRLGTTNPKD
ncbi:MAG: HlyC/CorC family transporter [Calditrichae bacterium]|nr:HlyC/CorC family transporter [Calditrichia bacterium]